MNPSAIFKKIFLFFTFFIHTTLTFAAHGLNITGYANTSNKNATMGSAYLSLTNNTAKEITLIKAKSSHSKYTEYHTHKHMGDMMKMVQLKELKIPAHSTLKMQPGKIHVMLIQLQKPLVENQHLDLELIDKEGKIYKASVIIEKRH